MVALTILFVSFLVGILRILGKKKCNSIDGEIFVIINKSKTTIAKGMLIQNFLNDFSIFLKSA